MIGRPAWTRSIRFRLTLIYSVALFLLAALVLAVLYAGLREALDDEPVSARVVSQQIFPIDQGVLLVGRQEAILQFNTVEQLANQRALEQLRNYSFAALGGLFVLSFGVGWVVAGRALKPIDRITEVARDITATDLSRRIDLDGPDDELSRLAGTFDDMLGRLDRSFEGQRRFIHEASHELRNPLATIRTNLEVALADPDADVDDLRQTAEVVDRSAERMTRVVDDLLAYARSEVPDPEYLAVDMGDLVAEVAEEFRGTADAAAVDLRMRLSPQLAVYGEPDSLRRVVANILANAIEHSPSGSRILIELTADGTDVVLSVADSGPGVPEADRTRVFDRTWRGEAAARRRPAGSGLGLAIVDEVVSTHNGSADVVERAGGGAMFRVRLPRLIR